jgi:hypothetical protein
MDMDIILYIKLFTPMLCRCMDIDIILYIKLFTPMLCRRVDIYIVVYVHIFTPLHQSLRQPLYPDALPVHGH